MANNDDLIARVVDTLKAPVAIDPELDRRVMAEIASGTEAKRSISWWSRRWTIQLTPAGALAAAAVFGTIVFGGVQYAQRSAPAAMPVVTVATPPAGQDARVMQFVLVAPDAKSVSLVGDFNDWNEASTQLKRQSADGVWWVTVTLPPGRYRYAFVVDGTAWRNDPDAPSAEDDFGRPNSVVTVGGAT